VSGGYTVAACRRLFVESREGSAHAKRTRAAEEPIPRRRTIAAQGSIEVFDSAL